jgi:hypothetical protein
VKCGSGDSLHLADMGRSGAAPVHGGHGGCVEVV